MAYKIHNKTCFATADGDTAILICDSTTATSSTSASEESTSTTAAGNASTPPSDTTTTTTSTNTTTSPDQNTITTVTTTTTTTTSTSTATAADKAADAARKKANALSAKEIDALTNRALFLTEPAVKSATGTTANTIEGGPPAKYVSPAFEQQENFLQWLFVGAALAGFLIAYCVWLITPSGTRTPETKPPS